MAATGRDRATQRDVAFACQVGDVDEVAVKSRGARKVQIKALARTLNTAGQAQGRAIQAGVASQSSRAVVGLAAEGRNRTVERDRALTAQVRNVDEVAVKGRRVREVQRQVVAAALKAGSELAGLSTQLDIA